MAIFWPYGHMAIWLYGFYDRQYGCPIDNESLVEINAQENNDNIRDLEVVDTELRGKCAKYFCEKCELRIGPRGLQSTQRVSQLSCAQTDLFCLFLFYINK